MFTWFKVQSFEKISSDLYAKITYETNTSRQQIVMMTWKHFVQLNEKEMVSPTRRFLRYDAYKLRRYETIRQLRIFNDYKTHYDLASLSRMDITIRISPKQGRTRSGANRAGRGRGRGNGKGRSGSKKGRSRRGRIGGGSTNRSRKATPGRRQKSRGGGCGDSSSGDGSSGSGDGNSSGSGDGSGGDVNRSGIGDGSSGSGSGSGDDGGDGGGSASGRTASGIDGSRSGSGDGADRSGDWRKIPIQDKSTEAKLTLAHTISVVDS
jgi:hypothetical protein